MLRQLEKPVHSSKDAPRPPLSNARSFVSFGSLPESLRAHLWTLAFKKKNTKYACRRVFFQKKQFKMFITLIKRRDMGKLFYMTINQLKRCAKTFSFQRIMFRIIRTITGAFTLPFVDTLFEKKTTKNACRPSF